MKTLYHVLVVTQKEEIPIDVKVVAKSEDGARQKAGIYSVLDSNKLNVDDVTVIVKNLGAVKVE